MRKRTLKRSYTRINAFDVADAVIRAKANGNCIPRELRFYLSHLFRSSAVPLRSRRMVLIDNLYGHLPKSQRPRIALEDALAALE
jgi:hypothetical protein